MRTNTELEEKLIKAGFHLESKTYAGKRSEKTRNYIYKGWYSFEELSSERIEATVILNSTRTKIVDWGIDYPSGELYNITKHFQYSLRLERMSSELQLFGIDMNWDFEPW